MGQRLRHALRALGVVLGSLLATPEALAQAAKSPPQAVLSGGEPEISNLVGRNVARIEVTFDPPLWAAEVELRGVRVGQTFTPELARRALDELADSGRFGELAAEAEPLGQGVLLRLRGVARRVIAAVRVSGVEGDVDELLRAARIRAGSEVTARELPLLASRLTRELGRRGYPDARVRTDTFDSDDPSAIVLSFDVARGAAARVTLRKFRVWPDPKAAGLRAILARYQVAIGDRADSEAIEAASRSLEETLRQRGFHEARVEHSAERRTHGIELDVRVYAGALVRVRIEGNRRFDTSELEAALELSQASDRSAQALAERVRAFYVARGFLDAQVTPRLRSRNPEKFREIALVVREGEPIRVVERQYPCLGAERSAASVGSEIDSFLSELPGGTLIEAVDPRAVDALFGPKRSTGKRPAPFELNPWSVYSADVYDRALDHLRDLFRSEGYLSASVGPVTLGRRRCDVRSPPGACLGLGARHRPPVTCSYDAIGLPTEEPAVDASFSCIEDLARGIRCEPQVVLSIPVKLGPRSFISRVRIDGNLNLPDEQLSEAAELELGDPVSQLEIDRARRRVLDRYAEEGFSFAEVETALELSPDHRQAEVVFVISERKQVKVSRIVVRGARITSESLIRGRIALSTKELYRRSLVRKTEERLATLGVFSNVSVGLEDPHVPASEKVVVISVQERVPQHLDLRPGFSTGEGFRITFEYGHENLAGQAIRLTLRSQLGFLPLALILENDVRKKYEELAVDERLERRNTATVEFPEVGLGPLFRLSVEGVDVRDNARDFGLTKEAGIVALSFMPERRLSFQLSGSLERNDARIFGKEALDEYIRAHPEQRNAFHVPEGKTIVWAQRFGATWDRRDNPLDATSGSLFSAAVEHVSARPLEAGTAVAPGMAPSVFAAVDSRFLRYTNRIAGYVRLSERGLAIAAAFRWGLNHQLTSASRTYPDRLFFLGGVDSLRGFLQDSVVPEDVAQKLLEPGEGPSDQQLRVDQIVIRGGDFFINPRLELRIPLSQDVQTALFVDSGNLWTETAAVDRLRLRYSTGTGLRIGTPIGPLVFDYGFNVERVLDVLDPSRSGQRYWEELGAFHFSIGLF